MSVRRAAGSWTEPGLHGREPRRGCAARPALAGTSGLLANGAVANPSLAGWSSGALGTSLRGGQNPLDDPHMEPGADHQGPVELPVHAGEVGTRRRAQPDDS